MCLKSKSGVISHGIKYLQLQVCSLYCRKIWSWVNLRNALYCSKRKRQIYQIPISNIERKQTKLTELLSLKLIAKVTQRFMMQILLVLHLYIRFFKEGRFQSYVIEWGLLFTYKDINLSLATWTNTNKISISYDLSMDYITEHG